MKTNNLIMLLCVTFVIALTITYGFVLSILLGEYLIFIEVLGIIDITALLSGIGIVLFNSNKIGKENDVKDL